MLPNDALQQPKRGWVRRTVRALTAAALFAIPLVALTQLGPGLVHGLTADAAAAPATPLNPLTFDAPARTVERAAVQKKDANRAAARLAAAKREEATELDDWHFTQFSYSPWYNYQSPYYQSNEYLPFFFGFGGSLFAFQPSPFGFGYGYGFSSIFILQVPQFVQVVIVQIFSFPRFFHRHQSSPPIIIIINPPPVSPYR